MESEHATIEPHLVEIGNAFEPIIICQGGTGAQTVDESHLKGHIELIECHCYGKEALIVETTLVNQHVGVVDLRKDLILGRLR